MASKDDLSREVLPILDRKPAGLTTYDAKDPDTKFPPIRPLRPPAGAPNILIVLLDADYSPRGNAFSGTIKWVQIEIDAAAMDVDHLIGAEERADRRLER